MHAIFYKGDIANSHIADMLKEMLMDQVYLPYLTGRTDAVILDIGANVGIFSLYASNFGTVHAFEPAKEHMECLLEMVSYNKLTDKIKAYNVAISNEDGETTLYHAKNPTSHSLAPDVYTTGISEQIRTWTMKTLFEKTKLDHVDLLKIDVEGWEFKILASKEFQECIPKIHTIVGEYHQWTNTDPRQMIAMLKDYGYDAGWLDRSHASIFYATRK